MSEDDGRVVSLFAARTPPSNIQAEQALLGAIMATPKAFALVEGFLKAEHFADAIHGRVFSALAGRIAVGRVADLISIRGDFETAGGLSEVGGMAYLTQLQGAMVSPRTAGEYGRVIREAWERRQMIEAGQALIDRAYSDVDPAAARGQHRAVLDSLDDEDVGARNRPTMLREATERALAAADRAAAGGGVVGVSTGMGSVDDVLGGFEAGSLTVLGGRPGSGKSSLGHQWALAAARARVPVAEFSLEMSAASLGRRALSVASGVPIWRMRRGQHAGDVEALTRAHREMADLPLEIHDGSRFSAIDIAARCRASARKHGLGLIVVDHLHLVPAETASARHGPTAGVTEVVDALLGVAKQMNVPMLLLAQLSRGVESREDHRPNLADLRQSGAIEQNADAVAFVYRAEQYLSRDDPPKGAGESAETYANANSRRATQRIEAAGKAELLCEKVRDGEPGTVHLRFDGPTASFSEGSA